MKKFILVLLFSSIGSVLAADDLQTLYNLEAKGCTTITCIREKIDGINDEILKALVRRTAYVQRAGDLKLHTKTAEDRKRVEDQIQVIKRKSKNLGLPEEISVEAFKAIIENSVRFQQNYIDQQTQ